MKTILLLVVSFPLLGQMFPFPGPGLPNTTPAGISVVNGAIAFSNSALSVSASNTLNVNTGDQLWLFLYWAATTTPCTPTITWTASAGTETFTAQGTNVVNGWVNGQCTAQFTVESIANASSTDTISVTISGGGSTAGVIGFDVIQMRGTSNATADQTANNGTSGPPSTTMTVGPITTTNAAEIVVCGVSTPGNTPYSATVNGTFGVTGTIPPNVNPGSNQSGVVLYTILSSTATGSCGFTFGGAVTFTGQMASYH